MNRLVLLLISGFFALNASSVFATSYTVDIVANVPGCGDGILQLGEECDGTNLGGASCETVGFDAGTLSCSSACTFLTNSCSLALPSASGGGTRAPNRTDNQQLPESNVVVSGLASPGMNVSLLKDGQKVATVPAKADGRFQITISGLSGGVYRMQAVGIIPGFGITRSDVFNVQVLKDATTKIASVVLPPSIVIIEDANQYRVQGAMFPGSTAAFYINQVLAGSLLVDPTGLYRFALPPIAPGVAAVVSVTATLPGGVDSYKSTELLVPAPAQQQDTSDVTGGCGLIADINNDCSVDAVDFFVSRWRYVRDLFSERFDYNDDGEVDLVDFSIMAFYWTG